MRIASGEVDIVLLCLQRLLTLCYKVEMLHVLPARSEKDYMRLEHSHPGYSLLVEEQLAPFELILPFDGFPLVVKVRGRRVARAKRDDAALFSYPHSSKRLRNDALGLVLVDRLIRGIALDLSRKGSRSTADQDGTRGNRRQDRSHT